MDREILAWLAQAAPIALRVGGLLTFAPFLGDRGVPSRVKAGLAVALTALLVPVVASRPVPLAAFDWARMAMSEALVGLLMGLCLQVVFEGMQFAGQLSGIQIGLSLATLFDPQSAADSPVLSVFYNLVALLIFLECNVHHWLLRAVERSFEYLPAGEMVVSELLTRQFVHVVGALFVLGIQIAAPVLVATMLMDLVLGFLSKASPTIPALLMGVPVKNLTGLALLGAACSLWPAMLERRFAFAIGAAEKMLRLAR